MATFIALGNFTDQGLRTINESTKRADLAKELAGKYGVNMKEVYWLQGQYDLLTICEAADEATLASFGLAIAGAGNVRLQTMRAFTKDEMNDILKKLR